MWINVNTVNKSVPQFVPGDIWLYERITSLLPRPNAGKCLNVCPLTHTLGYVGICHVFFLVFKQIGAQTAKYVRFFWMMNYWNCYLNPGSYVFTHVHLFAACFVSRITHRRLHGFSSLDGESFTHFCKFLREWCMDLDEKKIWHI